MSVVESATNAESIVMDAVIRTTVRDAGYHRQTINRVTLKGRITLRIRLIQYILFLIYFNTNNS